MTSLRAQIEKEGSELERAFDTQFRALASDLPLPEKQYRFDSNRRWEIDRAWPPYKVGIELEGGSYGRRIVCHNCGTVVRAATSSGRPGRETRAAGWHGRLDRFLSDREKYNAASMQGWIILRFVQPDVYENPSGMVELIRQALENRAYGVRPVEPGLTAYQVKILRLMAAGLVQQEIAERLDTTHEAIRRQSDRICERLMATNRPNAVARALVWGIIDPSEIPWRWDTYVLAQPSGTVSVEEQSA